ncbi:MAG: anhydro-N-acetylmuramic acid kinase [Bradyrhizobiaceae bacterium]|nr:anhydro-N-acetylmuramic acid kinase [Bradyrhizobiaceae bacterium]
MIIAGVMTGTSVDAIDVALCNIQDEGGRHAVTLFAYSEAPYPIELEEKVKGALAGTASMADLSAIPFELASAYAEAINTLVKEANVTLDLVAVHGQTLWHEPPLHTWQAMSGPALSALLSIPVVHDFRAADVAVGGQGAPLVPIFDVAVLQSTTVDRVALNIGGMANITLLPAGGGLDDVRAFDTGPGNVLIDAVCKASFGKRFDNDGAIARSGIIIQRALSELQALPYFAQEPPKSTGRELFGEQMANDLWRRFSHPSMPSEDLITTLTELTAWSIADHIQRYQPSTTEVLVSGGGARNAFLLERLSSYLRNMVVKPTDTLGVPSDAKEAMAFAYLGYRTYHGLAGNIPTVTGATAPVVLGSIANAR